MTRVRQLFATFLTVVLAVGMIASLAPTSVAGKGGGKGGGPPGPDIPPDCPCEDVLSPAPGVVCVLDYCAELFPDAWECGYVCTF